VVAALHAAEHALLAVAGVPNPIGEEVADVHPDQERLGPCLLPGNSLLLLKWKRVWQMHSSFKSYRNRELKLLIVE
jgi:hypothetical protein